MAIGGLPQGFARTRGNGAPIKGVRVMGLVNGDLPGVVTVW